MTVTQAQRAVAEKLGDEDLVRLARGRDEAAVRAITNRYNRRLFRIARGIVRNDAEAEDVVQETYVRAFTGLEMFRGDAAFGTWITRIAMNEALGRLRRQRPTVDWETLWGQSQRGRDHQFSTLGGQQRSGENNGARGSASGSGTRDR
jgi:RNA polymerase sigma-70 factor (ECF subfamily)